MLNRQQIIQDVADTLCKAGSSFRPDQAAAYRDAIEREDTSKAKWVLENILENAVLGEKNKLPLCDDTGIPHLFLELGDEAALPPGFLPAVEEGIRIGLQRLPGRPMAVRGDDSQRIDQSQGLFDDPAMLASAPLQIVSVPGKQIKLTVLMYGGGPEIRGKTQSVFHHHSLDKVKQTMIEWGREGTKLLGCLPAVLSFGVGRSNLEAASLSLRAMAEGLLNQQNPLEREITEAINITDAGPLGIGGKVTVLGTFIKVGPQRASGVRIISLRVGCCFDPRRSTVTWDTV